VPWQARTVQQLDNPIWHALTGPQAKVAERVGDAVRYHPEFSVFAALPDRATPDDWAALATLVGPRGQAILFGADSAGPGWEFLGDFGVHQMVATAVADVDLPDGFVDLGPADAAAMAALVAATEPGPWAARTHELGAFVGVRDGSRLVAMVGQRMRLPGAVEISAVCTEPDQRGKGLASRLTAIMAARIVAEGATAILHVREDNDAAIRAYRRAGFEHRVTARPGLFIAPG
jgi:ribosomal protein S18 acetylase RimI-like enzyme